MHIKSFYTQQHCYVSLKNLIPWRDPNPGHLVPEADAMSTAPRRQGGRLLLVYAKNHFSFMRQTLSGIYIKSVFGRNLRKKHNYVKMGWVVMTFYCF
jgi:hypothetical protein